MVTLGSSVKIWSGWKGPEDILAEHLPSSKELGERYSLSVLLFGLIPIGLSFTRFDISIISVFISFRLNLVSPRE